MRAESRAPHRERALLFMSFPPENTQIGMNAAQQLQTTPIVYGAQTSVRISIP
jgi:hypothetical protein